MTLMEECSTQTSVMPSPQKIHSMRMSLLKDKGNTFTQANHNLHTFAKKREIYFSTASEFISKTKNLSSSSKLDLQEDLNLTSEIASSILIASIKVC
jgi:hypothetical protein